MLQLYHGCALRNHINNIDRMELAVWPVYYYSISTDDNPSMDNPSMGTALMVMPPHDVNSTEQKLVMKTHLHIHPQRPGTAVKPILDHLSER